MCRIIVKPVRKQEDDEKKAREASMVIEWDLQEREEKEKRSNEIDTAPYTVIYVLCTMLCLLYVPLFQIWSFPASV